MKRALVLALGTPLAAAAFVVWGVIKVVEMMDEAERAQDEQWARCW